MSDSCGVMDESWRSADLVLGCAWLSLATCSLAVGCVPFLAHIANHGKQTQLNGENTNDGGLIQRIMNIMVPKQLFTVMYLYGVTLSIGIICLSNNTVIASTEMFCPWQNRNLVLTLWIVHLTRRLLECILITDFGRSEMHVTGFLVGIWHYTAAPVTFFCVHGTGFSKRNSFIKLLAVSLFIVSNVMQCKFHYILYCLKSSYVQPNGQRYALPESSWFKVVACPHYSAEIVIYISMWLLSLPDISISMMSLVVWVSSNLAVVAGRQYIYYTSTFADKIPKTWSKLIPGIF